MTTIFGNPGSTELPLFRDFPDDFRYVLGLQEVGRRRHGRRLRAGHAQRGVRQPAFGGRRRPRDGQHLHRLSEPHAAGHHRRPAGALDPAVRAVPVRHAGDQAARTVREVEQRAGARRGRAGRDRARLLPGDAAAVRADVRLDSGRRLGPHVGADRHAHGQPRARIRTRSCSRRSPTRSIAARGPRSSSGPASIATARGTRWSRSPSGIRRSCGSARCRRAAAFPERHPLFAGFLPPMREQIVKRLAGHDLILALGAPVFTYHIEGFGPHVPPGAELVQMIDDPTSPRGRRSARRSSAASGTAPRRCCERLAPAGAAGAARTQRAAAR